jgi:hypothetical protein
MNACIGSDFAGLTARSQARDVLRALYEADTADEDDRVVALDCVWWN